jgi:NADPH:quinone reductase
MTQTMKALFVVPGPDGGGNKFRDIPVPTPGPSEVLLAVRAAGTNRGELLARPLLRSDDPAAKPIRAGIECAGEIVPVLDRTFPFERIGDAHAYMLSDAQIGKIVVTIGDDAAVGGAPWRTSLRASSAL